MGFPKRGLDNQICSFFCRNFDQKLLEVYYKVSLSENFHRQNCSTINYLSNDINILAGDDPFSVEFSLKGTDPPIERMRVSFHMRRAVQSAIADLVTAVNQYDF